MIAFWCLAPIMVLAALGVVFARKAVHSALMLAVVMIALAVLYAALDAPFLFAVQIIVYTGAVLMLFLFVLMLIGVDTPESLAESLRGQRVAAAVVGGVFALLVILAIAQTTYGAAVGLDSANANGNVEGVAQLLFSNYIFAFEATSALLITAAVGAMVLAHRERLTPKATQKEMVLQRMRDYAERGTHPGALPNPGTFARHNSNDTPALLPDGTPSDLSISRALRHRGLVRDVGADVAVATEIEGESRMIEGGDDE
jgi:NADH-quinone oxidoreductase subunit J